MLQALEMYGIENVLVCQEDLLERGLKKEDLLLTPQLIERSDVPHILREQDRVLTF